MCNRMGWILACILIGRAAMAVEPAAGAGVFGLTVSHSVHLTVAAKDYAEMEPPPGVNPFAPKPGANAGRPAPGNADFGAGSFGYEFKYVHADIEIDGKLLKDVGLRYKGNGTYMMSSRAAKRSFKLDFDRYNAKQDYRGLKKLNLHSGAMDASLEREALAYTVFAAAGVPVPRTAFAEVTLTVPGKFERERLGVYTVVEQVDKSFLAAHFKNGKGLLLKPEGIRGLPHLGDEAAAYETAYNAKEGESPEGWKRLIELTRMVNKADEVEFRAKIGTYLDVEGFERFLAANAILASMDGFIGLGHNYYLYLSPDSGRFTFLPWDLDLAFGSFAIYGSTEQLTNLSIDHPHLGENKLIDRLLAMPEVKARYRSHLQRLAAEMFTPAKLGQEIEKVEALLNEPLALDRKALEARKEAGGFGFGGPGMGGPFGAPTMPLKTFVEKRSASVLAQLEGKGKGFTPAMSFGFGPPGGFGPGSQLAKPLLDAMDSNKDGKVSEAEVTAGMGRLLHEWDADGNGTLDQKELGEGLQKLMPPPSFGPPPQGPGGPPR